MADGRAPHEPPPSRSTGEGDREAVEGALPPSLLAFIEALARAHAREDYAAALAEAQEAA